MLSTLCASVWLAAPALSGEFSETFEQLDKTGVLFERTTVTVTVSGPAKSPVVELVTEGDAGPATRDTLVETKVQKGQISGVLRRDAAQATVIIEPRKKGIRLWASGEIARFPGLRYRVRGEVLLGAGAPPPSPARAGLDGNDLRVAAFAPGGDVLAARGSSGCGLRVFDVKTAKVKKVLVPDACGLGSGSALAFHAAGKWLAAASFGGEVDVYDGASFEYVRTLSSPAKSVSALAFSADGERLFAAGSHLVAWKMADGRVEKTVEGGGSQLTLSPDGRTLLLIASKGSGQTGAVVDAASLETVRALDAFDAAVLGAKDALYVARGKTVEESDARSGAKRREVTSGQRVYRLALTGDPNTLVVDGQTLDLGSGKVEVQSKRAPMGIARGGGYVLDKGRVVALDTGREVAWLTKPDIGELAGTWVSDEEQHAFPDDGTPDPKPGPVQSYDRLVLRITAVDAGWQSELIEYVYLPRRPTEPRGKPQHERLGELAVSSRGVGLVTTGCPEISFTRIGADLRVKAECGGQPDKRFEEACVGELRCRLRWPNGLVFKRVSAAGLPSEL